MALSNGTPVGAYDILEMIGKGGMGEVYRARDKKLGRDVAIKALPEEFALSAERLGRFEREAKLLASLNHPNIATIYGIEESAGSRFLILELVEGETLADRLTRGAVPIEEALHIALQVADALDAAHEKGVIHRDLKPANIRITPNGVVKVLDFGLAKALGEDEPARTTSDSPTLSMAATQQGIILGTAAYMSPEQAKGRPAGRAADIWAFGCVLYEMLSGRAAFDGDDLSEILASVIKATTDLSVLPPDVPPPVRRILKRCLEKDVKKRYRDIGDVRIDLAEAVADGGSAEPTGEAPVELRSGRFVPGVALAFLILGIALASAAWWILRPSPLPTIVTRFSDDWPQENVGLRNTGRRGIAVSRDGRFAVFNTNKGILVRDLDAPAARLIPRTEAALSSPSLSPDGQWIAFQQDKLLKKISINGGAAVSIANATSPFGLRWEDDDTIVYGQPDGVWRVSSNGGTPQKIVAAEKGEEIDSPSLLPGGWVLFTTRRSAQTRWDEATIVAAPLKGGERRVLITGGSDGQYLPSGHLVYLTGKVLFGRRFDVARLALVGGPVSVIEGIPRGPSLSTGEGQYAVSPSGTVVYIFDNNTIENQRRLVFADRSGAETSLAVPPKAYMSPRLSPDGKKVAVQSDELGGSVIWIFDLSGKSDIRQLTVSPGKNSVRPVWTPDSQRVTFASDRDGTMSIYWQSADGSGPVERLTTAEQGTEHWPDSWSPDGKTLSFALTDKDGGTGVWTFSADSKKITPFVHEPRGIQRSSTFSPDGKWIAYHSNENNLDGFDIYIKPFPTGEKIRVTQNRRSTPAWSDHNELFFSTPAATTLFVRSIDTKAGLTFGTERTLPLRGFQPFLDRQGYRAFDISRDGQRVLLILTADEPNPASNTRFRPIQFIVNWFTELQQRVPVQHP